MDLMMQRNVRREMYKEEEEWNRSKQEIIVFIKILEQVLIVISKVNNQSPPPTKETMDNLRFISQRGKERENKLRRVDRLNNRMLILLILI